MLGDTESKDIRMNPGSFEAGRIDTTPLAHGVSDLSLADTKVADDKMSLGK